MKCLISYLSSAVMTDAKATYQLFELFQWTLLFSTCQRNNYRSTNKKKKKCTIVFARFSPKLFCTPERKISGLLCCCVLFSFVSVDNCKECSRHSKIYLIESDCLEHPKKIFSFFSDRYADFSFCMIKRFLIFRCVVILFLVLSLIEFPIDVLIQVKNSFGCH